ncbi:MAG: HlyD family secretion protein [Marinifilaceae bacterium]
MKSIFPKEIIDHTTEAHFTKFNSTTRGIYLLLILLLLSGIAVLPVVSVPITQQGRGTVRTMDENNRVIAAIYGQVEENRLYENLKVQVGDTLMLLNSQKIEHELDALKKELELNEVYQQDLTSLLVGKSVRLKSTLYQNDLAEYKQKLVELNAEIRRKEKDYRINKSLFEKQVIAKLDFEEKEYSYQQTLQNRELYLRQKNLQWQNRLDEIKRENLEVESRKAQLEKEKENYVIKAPVSGAITHFAGVQAGNFLAPSQTLAQISPKGNLMVECYISPGEIGYIRKDMEVAFQLDAFNYNQWGLGHGRVLEISPDIFQVENNAFFKVRCSLEKDHLVLKNGYVGNLKKGMTLTARFQVTERTLFQLLYDKVDDWLNPRLNG